MTRSVLLVARNKLLEGSAAAHGSGAGKWQYGAPATAAQAGGVRHGDALWRTGRGGLRSRV